MGIHHTFSLKIMKLSSIAAAFLFCAVTAAQAQTPVSITITTDLNRHMISPLIYGIGNGSNNPAGLNITSRRLGGDRMCTYNWENNASNSGGISDGVHLWLNDNYLGNTDNPAALITDFHDASKQLHSYSLITLQAMGYVAKDKNGYVAANEAAPSNRWAKIIFDGGSNAAKNPDVADDNVYLDEEVNFLKAKYGPASAGGVNAYGFDNEPGLWLYAFSRACPPAKIYPTYTQSVAFHTAMATMIKRIDPSAEFFGGTMYGFSEFENLNGDGDGYNAHGWYVDYLLSEMKKSSDAAGMRLMDALDLHWYPEAQGRDDAGDMVRIVFDPNHADHENDLGVAAARMQAPRSLWDATYDEGSWITKDHTQGPINLLNRIQGKIDANNPGTKLAIGEYDYGGQNHISGGIATADVLGIFGDLGLYFANYWGDPTNYAASGMKLYRNYDGNNSTFGSISVSATTDNIAMSSVHASLENAGNNTLHLVVLNKNYDNALAATVAITSGVKYTNAVLYGFDRNDAAIRQIGTINDIANNTFSYTIPALSAYHIVLHSASSGVASAESTNPNLQVLKSGKNITILMPANPHEGEMEVYNSIGQKILSQTLNPYMSRSSFDMSTQPSGAYFVMLKLGKEILTTSFVTW